MYKAKEAVPIGCDRYGNNFWVGDSGQGHPREFDIMGRI